MKNKVLLILIDGLRPDAIMQAKNPFLRDFIKECTYCDKAKSVYPSITLPCHMSLFHSVPPERHGTLENTYVRPVHKLEGLFEVLAKNNKKCAFFYTWEELRDLGRPGSLSYQEFCSWYTYEREADCKMCNKAIEYIKEEEPDFLFYYTGHTDEQGHVYGWMSDEYLEAVDLAIDNTRKLIEALPKDYSVIITADHGGHERIHGTKMQEDMTIPMLLYGNLWQKNAEISNVGLLDVAPTIAALLECPIPREWEGTSMIGLDEA